ncbi:hypothetical protein R5R35_010919 [Gryllus longicercus]|uniref:DDE Tnp4 domain-containing protein n=1 Tax=Gryllus longicercus TaxID=2509291 RepID=A0AAN9VFK4_9ORTH
MDDFYEFYEFVQDVVERSRRLPRRYIRDFANPLEHFSDRQFQERYRFQKRTVVEFLYPLMIRLSKPDNRGKPVPVMIKLLIALRFFATGIYQKDNGDIHGISQGSVCVIVKPVAEILAGELRNYVRLPLTHQQKELTKQKFCGIRQFPGVVGCVAGTHIEIDSPGGNVPEVYRNKKTFSLNVQVIAGRNLEIQDITVRYPGSFHDARIFRLSGLDIPFERGKIHRIILGGQWLPL